MNESRFGSLFRVTTFGESHGDFVGAVIEGVPAGFRISLAEIQRELYRRRPGYGRTVSHRREPDVLEVVSGIVKGKTTGGPVRLQVRNRDARPSDYDEILHKPRPGHADLANYLKFGRMTAGGGRSSGRETVGRVLAGAVAKQLLAREGIRVTGRVAEVRGKRTGHQKTILEAKAKNDSVGGIVEIIAEGVPPGLGEPVFDGLDAELAKALMSIGSVKGVEIGAGFRSTRMRGSEHNDPILVRDGKLRTATNNAGGILGGISSGMPVECRIAVKPTSSIGREQDTVDLVTMKPAKISVKGRHDPCICRRIVPVAESMVAITLLEHLLRSRRAGIGAAGTGKGADGSEKGSVAGKEPLEGLRDKVKRGDREMVRLLKKRMELTGEIGTLKKARRLAVKDPAVERAVMRNALSAGRKLGLAPEIVEKIMRAVMAESRRRQKA